VVTAKLLAYCREQGLGGLEFLAGIPGTVGGAVAGNAGAWGHGISERLLRLTIVTPEGTRRECASSELDFSYRHMELRGGVVAEAEFSLEPRKPGSIGLRMAQHARDRAERHPLGEPSAGCIFRNAPGHPAGKLLDLCGLKGLRVGGAEVSKLHANFILNRGGATTADVLRLIDIMKEAVRREFGIELEMEVQRWPGRAKAA
jgi:UDP-N-acetylmuramate dehydrogenase